MPGMLINPYRFSSSDFGLGNDPYWDDVVLLSKFHGANGSTAATDISNIGHTLTATGNVSISTAASKWSDSSSIYDNSGDYWEIADSDNLSFTAEVTMEAWVRFITTGDGAMITKWSSTVGVAEWHWSWSGTNWIFAFYDITGVYREASHADTVAADTWYFMSVSKDSSGDVRIFRDGVLIGKTNLPWTMRNIAQPVRIGSRNHGTTPYHLNGYIDSVRVTKDVARYTSDGGHAVPTTAFPEE
jgi:hypothetical protein